MGILKKVDLQDGFVLSPVEINGNGVQPILVSQVLVIDGTNVQDPEATGGFAINCLLAQERDDPIGTDKLGGLGPVDASLLVPIQASHGRLLLQNSLGNCLLFLLGNRLVALVLFQSLVEGVESGNHREGFGCARKQCRRFVCSVGGVVVGG